MDETFQSGKGLFGPDEHQVHRYASWSCWVTLVIGPVRDTAHRLGWSDWRRHQARSQASHYQRQATQA